MKLPTLKGCVAFFALALLCSVTLAAEPSAETLKTCPNGHETLKDVPIAYGLPAFSGPEADKFEKGVKDLEFYPGGCVVTGDSPKYVVICKTCRFTHMVLLVGQAGTGSWTRSAPGTNSFPRPFGELVTSFPIPSKESLKEPVKYTQNLTENLEVRYEGVGFTATRSASDLKKEINTWLKDRGIKTKYSSKRHKSTLDGAVREILEWETEKLAVAINIHYEHSDKSSWVNATFYKPLRHEK